MVGAVWLMYLLGYNISIAAWVGMIALMGLDAETGVFMLLFLDLSYEEARKEGRLRTMADLHEAIIHGAVKRIRPKLMTVAAASMGLMPIMWSVGHRRGPDEAGRRPDGRRSVHVVPHGTAGLSGDLLLVACAEDQDSIRYKGLRATDAVDVTGPHALLKRKQTSTSYTAGSACACQAAIEPSTLVNRPSDRRANRRMVQKIWASLSESGPDRAYLTWSLQLGALPLQGRLRAERHLTRN